MMEEASLLHILRFRIRSSLMSCWSAFHSIDGRRLSREQKNAERTNAVIPLSTKMFAASFLEYYSLFPVVAGSTLDIKLMLPDKVKSRCQIKQLDTGNTSYDAETKGQTQTDQSLLGCT
eukprot:3223818-Amphidinium_carterae.1